MSTTELITILIFGVIAATFIVGRWLYDRSRYIKSQLQMSTVFTNITHELLTPLTILSASVEKLRGEHPEEAQELELMDLNIQRSVRLLQQILETSKSQAGELKLLVSNGDVMQYIRETARTIEPLMRSKHLSLTIQCKPESMMGWIDTDKLDKIIFNLLSNSVKYTNSGGSVSLKVNTNDRYDRITIQVSDTGIGIPAENMKRLFTRFYDGEYRKNHTFGTGLGLSLTRDLVYLHHGNINCQSEEGKGTTFTVNLPINKEAFLPSQIDERNNIQFNIPQTAIADMSTADHLASEIAETTDANAPYVLLVEDNPELLVIMKQLLQHKYHILTANNGAEALETAHNRLVDLVVSDVTMPEMDGYEMTARLKEDPQTRHLPVILLTARIQEEDQRQALLTGADDFMTKPFKLGDLQLRIDNLIANRQRLQVEHIMHSSETDEPPAVADGMTPLDREFLERAVNCVKKHLSDSDYDRDTFASDMGTSASTLYNKLRLLTGMNVSSFIRDIRIKTACRMAKAEPDLRVSDIAYKVGFRDPKYFATSFKKMMGMQPKEYFDRIRSQQ